MTLNKNKRIKINYKMFARRVKAARERADLTQEELALMAEVDRSNICTIEKGERMTGLETVIRLANAMDVSVESLIVDSYTHVDQVFPIYYEKFGNLLRDCSACEASAIYEAASAVKNAIRNGQADNKE